MNEAVVDRLLQVRRSALRRGDLNLVDECVLELLRYGVTVPAVPDYLAVEHAVSAAPIETAVHRTRARPRPKAAVTDTA